MAMNPSASLAGLKRATTAPPPPTKAPLSLAPPPMQGNAPSVSQDPSVPADYQGPENGPFECDNCSFFSAPKGCSQPDVLAEVGDADGDGLADVDPKGCCNKFSSMKSGGQ